MGNPHGMMQVVRDQDEHRVHLIEPVAVVLQWPGSCLCREGSRLFLIRVGNPDQFHPLREPRQDLRIEMREPSASDHPDLVL